MATKHTVGLSYKALQKQFRSGMTVRIYGDNEVIFSQGDAANALYYVESGAVKLTVVAHQKKAVIAFLRRGNFFGEGCLAGRSPRIYTARSIGQSNIVRLQVAGVLRALGRDPQFGKLFNANLLCRIIRMEEDLVDQFFSFSERRLARVLLLLGQIIADSKPEYSLTVSQSTLADMVGTTRARINKFMTEFKKKGLVHYNGGLQIDSSLIANFLQSESMSTTKKSKTQAR